MKKTQSFAEIAKKMSDEKLMEQIRRINEALPSLGEDDSISFSEAGLFMRYTVIKKACENELMTRGKMKK